MELFKILEETFLETYTDVLLGELKVNKFNEVEEEVSRRMSLEHNIDLKSEMQKYALGGLKFETSTPLDISKSMHLFIVKKYIPETSDLRRALLSKLDQSDRALIKKLSEECLNMVETKLDDTIDSLGGKEKEMKEILHDIELLKPSPFTILKYCPESFAKIAEIASKIDTIPDEYAESFYKLKREKIKTKLGKFGNLITTAIGYSRQENKKEFDVIELLMVK